MPEQHDYQPKEVTVPALSRLDEFVRCAQKARIAGDQAAQLDYLLKALEQAKIVYGANGTHAMYFFMPAELLVKLNRHKEAEPLLRAALRNNHIEPRGHLMTGLIVNCLSKVLEQTGFKDDSASYINLSTVNGSMN